MSSLKQLQQQLQHYLLEGNLAIAEAILPSDKLSVNKRLHIYRDAYHYRLLEALANNYPYLKVMLGDERFQYIGFAYIAEHPSVYRSIRWFGDNLPAYLSCDVSNEPYLAEFAAFEWALTLAFDAADAPTSTVQHMAAYPPAAWSDMRLSLHPSVHCLSFVWNVVLLWQQLSLEKPLTSPLQMPEISKWVLWRTTNHTNRYYELSAKEAWALDCVRQGQTFGKICEGLSAFIPEEDIGLTAATLLKGWLEAGLISEIIT